MLVDLLRQRGFSENEQKVLYALAGGQALRASIIAKRTGLKRPTAYLTLGNLIEQGFVVRRQKAKVQSFSMVSPELFHALLESRSELIYHQQKTTNEEIFSRLKSTFDQKRLAVSGFDITSTDSGEAVVLLLHELITSGDYDAIFNPQATLVTKATEQTVVDFLAETAQMGSRIREVAVSGPKTDWYRSFIKNPNHELREISADRAIASDMIITNELVALFHYYPRHESGITLRHAEFVQSMKVLFEITWEQAQRR